MTYSKQKQLIQQELKPGEILYNSETEITYKITNITSSIIEADLFKDGLPLHIHKYIIPEIAFIGKNWIKIPGYQLKLNFSQIKSKHR